MKPIITKGQSLTIRLTPEQVAKIEACRELLKEKTGNVTQVTKSDALRYMINVFAEPVAEDFDFLAELKKIKGDL